MKIAVSCLVASGALILAACHVYVDEPAHQAAAPAPPAPPAPKPSAPEPPHEAKVVPLRLHGAAPAGGTPAPAAPAACLDTGAGTAGDCAAMQPATSCPTAPTAVQKCNAYKAYFAPKVAAAAVSCLTGLTSAQVCDSTQVSACAKTALAQACPAPAVGQLCQIAAASCKATPADCTAALSGLSDQGQQAVAQCVATGCAGGLYACIDGLAGASATAALKH